jgi:predicted lipid-binding transport protein (Tim44 family)
MRLSVSNGFLLALAFLAIFGSLQMLSESAAEARAGGGRSSGSRGSRSYQAPARPAPSSPSQARREATPLPQQPAPMAPQGGGFMRNLGTAMLGGFLGSMLFSGLANAGFGGLGGSGFGMIEILLLAGVVFFLFRMFRNRAAMAGGGSTPYQDTNYQPSYNTGYQAPASAPVQGALPLNNVDYRSLTMMDQSFSPDQFLKSAQDIFFKVQGAWNKQDTNALRSLCGGEIMQTWEQELNDQRARGQQNKMENIALRESDITEAWTESGQDFITVRWLANLLDYTVDVKSGAVVNGSNADPIQFEEYWTFSRPVGPNAWKLSAVQQA